MKTNRKILKIAGIGFSIAAIVAMLFFKGEGTITFAMLAVGCLLFGNIVNKDGKLDKKVSDELKIAAVIFAVLLAFCSIVLFIVKSFI